MSQVMVPVAVNFHLYKPCNLRCAFCFATFRDVHGHLSLEDARRLIERLRESGAEKLNFAGGEPTLHPHIGDLVTHAKTLGFVTSLVTNGARLEGLIDKVGADLDWVALSVDSADEATQRRLGRGKGRHVDSALGLADLTRSRGIGLKLNTVVTALNRDEDMSSFVRRFAPQRWKVFQVLKIQGQNEGAVEPLLITRDEFDRFVRRHAHLATEGLAPVAEDNDAMTDSYAMIDPLGRFFGNSGGVQSYSRPILEVGVPAALAEAGYQSIKLEARGGIWAWNEAPARGRATDPHPL